MVSNQIKAKIRQKAKNEYVAAYSFEEMITNDFYRYRNITSVSLCLLLTRARSRDEWEALTYFDGL